MWEQLNFFRNDYRRAIGKHCGRGMILWLSWGIIGILSYRIERSLYLFWGGKYQYIRVLIYPILCIIQALSHLEINYKADIGPGLLIMHHNAGVVISGRSTIGKNLSLVGGNIIGIRNDSLNLGTIIIGDDVSIGANCVIVGPIKIGNNVKCGASACVISDIPDDCTVVGVPARIIKHHT